MQETKRTILYALIAAVSVGTALATHYLTKPGDISGVEGLGEPFFADFEDSTKAKSLRVVGFDEELATVREFAVEQSEAGQWVIPSHHNYPADAADQLNSTASSVIGITRGALASRYEADHERFGVIDPESDDGAKLKGRGQRITLKDDSDDVLTDLIIGSKVEDQAGNYYYVRLPEEKATYLADLDINLSTKFSDWIEDDLLKLDALNLVDLVVNKYSIDERRGPIDQEVSHLSRDASSDPWKLEDLADTEELLKDDISTMVSTLDNLKIMGVRPKPPGINADLTIDQTVVKSRGQLDQLQADLIIRGFPIFQVGDTPRIMSNEGEVIAATNEGIVYTLRFGEVYTGSQQEIETGFKSKDDEKKSSDADDKSSKDDESGADSKSKSDEEKISRYIFVSADFDEKFLDGKPEKPAEPPVFEKQDDNAAKDENKNAKEAEGSKDAAEDKGAEDKEATDDKEDENTEPDPNADEKKKYEEDLKKYESAMESWKKKVSDAEADAKELNDRFARWYYVISADDFEKLRLSRKAMVKAKEKKPAEPEAGKADPAKTGADSSGKPVVPESGNEAGEKSTADSPAKTDAGEMPAKNDADKEESAKADPPAADESKKTEPAKKPADEKEAATKPGKDEPAKADSKAADSKTDPKPPEQSEPAKTEPGKTEPAKTEPAKTEGTDKPVEKTGEQPAKTDPKSDPPKEDSKPKSEGDK